jgi:HrpA-like RNA helicase
MSNSLFRFEVHERQLDTDILLGLLKQALKTHKHLRVILMSATLDADRFAAYWGDATPRMHIPGRTFPVVDFMLEDVLALTGYIPPKKGKKGKQGFGSQKRRQNSSPWADSEKSDEEPEDASVDESGTTTEVAEDSSDNPKHTLPIEELVKRVDETSVDYDLLGQLVKNLVANRGPTDDGSILVFLAGAPEINNAMETIKRCTKGLQLLLLPLHGGLQPKDQNLVFRPSGVGITKVILSTNVAGT